MRSNWYIAGVLGVFLVTLGRAAGVAQEPQALHESQSTSGDRDDRQRWEFSQAELSRILRGFAITPVPLNLAGKDLALVGLGSYIVNGQGGCNDCHTSPPFAEGGNPHLGEPKQLNVAGYLAGGVPFGPPGDPDTPVSRNLTPRAGTGRPAGLTFQQFRNTMRTGVDLKNRRPFVPSEEGDLLQVMPWPVYGQMTNRDLRAIYEYLRAIPSLPSTP